MRVVVLTGAGISAESGLATFRDAGGLWEGHDPMQVATPEAYDADPALVQRFYDERRAALTQVRPNAAHEALARLEAELGEDLLVVTQNVDDLHERAASTQVYHLHGSLFHFRCDRCQSAYDGELPAMPEPVEAVQPPACPTCDGLIRPDVVWFGEQLPTEAWDRSLAAVAAADVAVVVGTSAIVYPAASLPELALAEGVPVIEVNPERTPLSDRATISLREKAATALPELLQRLPALLG